MSLQTIWISTPFFSGVAGWHGTYTLHLITSSTMKKDSACGKVLAGWLMVDSNGNRRGGYPTKTKMDHEPNKFYSSVDFLFYKDKYLATEVKCVISTGILLFHDEFNSIVRNEPRNKWTRWEDHPFNQRVLKAMSEAGA